MSEIDQGIVGLLTPKTQEGIEKLKISTGYNLSRVNLSESELKRLQDYQGFVRVVKDVLTTVVLNEGLDEPTRAKYNAALKEADEFLTHLEVRTLGVTFFRSLYKSAARLVEEQRTLAGNSNEKAGQLEAQLAELNGIYQAIESQYRVDKESWAAKEQEYERQLAQKDQAYQELERGKDTLQEMASTLARVNNELRKELAIKDTVIYELGQARERDAAKIAKAERDLESRVGQEKDKTSAAEDKTNYVIEALKQTLKDKYGLSEEELAEAAKDQDPAQAYLTLLNTKILEDKSSIKAVEARLEEERTQRADNYKCAVEGQSAEARQDDLVGALEEGDSAVELEVQAPDADKDKEVISPAEVVKKLRDAGVDPLLGLSLAAESVANAGAEAVLLKSAEAPAEIVAPETHDDEEHVIADVGLGEPLLPAEPAPEVVVPVAEEAPTLEEQDASEAETLIVEPAPEPAQEIDLAAAFGEAVPPVIDAPKPAEPDLAAAFAAAVPEEVVQPPAAQEIDLAAAFGEAVPAEEPK